MTQIRSQVVRSLRTRPVSLPVPTSELWYSALEQVPTAIALLDRSLGCLGASRAWQATFEMEGQTPSGRPLEELIPHLPHRWRQACEQSLATGETVEGEAEPVQVADRLLWLRWRSSPWQGPSGSIDGVWLWSEPVSRPQASESQLRTALDQAFQFISLLSLEGRVLAANQTALNFGGLERAAVLGKPFWQVRWWPLSRKVKRQLQASIAKAAEGRFIRLEVPVRDESQQVSVVLDVSVKPVRDEQGQVALLILEGRDISHRKEMEAALRRREALLAEAQKLLHVGSWDYDLARQVGSWSAELFRILGLQPNHSPRALADYLQSVEPADRERVRLALQRACDRGEPFELEHRSRRPDGTRRYLYMQGEAIRDEAGNITRLFCTLLDITDRKQAEIELQATNAALESRLAAQYQQLQTSESEFRTIFERAGVGLNFQNLDGRFIRVNQRWCEILGYGEAELLGLQFCDITYPPDRHLERPYLERLLAGDIPNFTLEKRYVHKDGSLVWVNLTKALTRDTTGQPQYFITAIADITERKRAEQEQVRLLAALDATTDLVAIADAKGNLCHLNRAGRRLLGWGPEESLADLHLLDLIGRSEQDTVRDQGLPALLRHGLWQGEGSLQHRDGAEIPVSQVAIAHTNDRGEIEFFSNIARDISDRKRVEATLRQQAADLEQALRQLQATQAQLVQTEKMSSLGQLVAGIAHEINNPVNFIYGNLNHAHAYITDLLALVASYQEHYPHPEPEIQGLAQAIELDFLTEDLPKLLDSMQVGANRIKDIVASLRTFSRTDEAASKAVDLHAGIDSTLMLLQNRCKPRADHPGIVIVKEYGDLPLLECYPSQLNQVFMNILANAIDALEERDRQRSAAEIQAQPSQIHISTHLTPGREACIHITDNGPGIPSTLQQRLFDPFFTTKPVGKGTGLGLSISYQIVTERHGGRLLCHSELGKGAEFVITIPVHQGSC